MKGRNNSIKNLVTVVIPCYNYGHFLSIAIESVLNQTYLNKEILVVDDGSSDNTAEVAASYKNVKYVYQQNGGLSSARNLGAAHSNGDFLVFLDADDWLYPEALEINASYLINDPSLELVSGAYDLINRNENNIRTKTIKIRNNLYNHLLEENYIAVPGSVMVRKKVFNLFKFDITLRTCEDYDLYLKISRNYPIHYHTKKIAAYVKHSQNMSGNIPLMLISAIKVLRRQKSKLRSKTEKNSYSKGKKFWINYYCSQLYLDLITSRVEFSIKKVFLLLYYKPIFMIKFLVHKTRAFIFTLAGLKS